MYLPTLKNVMEKCILQEQVLLYSNKIMVSTTTMLVILYQNRDLFIYFIYYILSSLFLI